MRIQYKDNIGRGAGREGRRAQSQLNSSPEYWSEVGGQAPCQNVELLPCARDDTYSCCAVRGTANEQHACINNSIIIIMWWQLTSVLETAIKIIATLNTNSLTYGKHSLLLQQEVSSVEYTTVLANWVYWKFIWKHLSPIQVVNLFPCNLLPT